MRTIYLLAMCLWLNACTATTPFPPEITKDTTTDTSVITAWKKQATYTSGANFSSTKVQLGGRIMQVIPKPGGVIILVEEQPLDRYLGHALASVGREGAFKFAIVFPGFPDDDMLKTGNPIAVVGETAGSRPEGIGSMPSVTLPHLLAQCLHIWKTEAVETGKFHSEGSKGDSLVEGQTFCRKEDNGKNLSTGDDRRFQVPRSAGGLQHVDHGASAHGLPAALQSLDISLGQY